MTQPDTQNRNLVAVVVPFSNRAVLTPDEQISLDHLLHFLGHYDKYIVAPESLEIDLPGFEVKRFSNRFFGSVAAHNKLMLSSDFYESFSGYKYILNYHLDALVFSDQLAKWCETDLDYIAPPWVSKSKDAGPTGFSRCGNGGLSLRKVESFLRIIHSRGETVNPDAAWGMIRSRTSVKDRLLMQPIKYMLRLKHIDRSWWIRSFYSRNEDRFWSDQARLIDPEFRVCSVEDGLQFGFDEAPAFCFERNGRRLPFGCHGWYKYDRSFWVPYLIKDPAAGTVSRPA